MLEYEAPAIIEENSSLAQALESGGVISQPINPGDQPWA